MSKISKVAYWHFRKPDIKGTKIKYVWRYGRKRRWFGDAINKNVEPYPRNGKTKCMLLLKNGDGEHEINGKALCNSVDNFNYKKGRSIALLRALLDGVIEHDLEIKIDDKNDALVLTFPKEQ